MSQYARGRDDLPNGPANRTLAGISRRQLMQRGAGVTGAALSTGSLAGFLAACGNSGQKAAQGKIGPGGILKASIGSQPDTLDPAKSPLSSSYEVFTNINSPLIGMDPDGNIVPRVASKWTQTDEKTVVFDLRDDVKFHNGDSVTADDVKYSLDRILDKKTASPWAGNFESIQDVEVNSPTQVTLHLKEAYAPLLAVLARNSQVVSRRAIESGNPGRKPVGCGPFEFVKWTQGDHIELRKFAGYYVPDRPYLDQVRVTWRAASPSAVEALRAREVNYLNALPPNLIASLKTDNAFNFTTSDTTGLPHMLAFNIEKEAVSDKLVRQAIAWAIDREAIHKVAYFSSGEKGSQEVGSGSKFFGPDPYADGPDLDKAKALLAQAGVSTPLDIEFMATQAVPAFGKMGEVVRDQLKQIGINLKVEVLEPSVWLDRLLAKDFETTAIFNETVSDPDQQYSLMFLSDGGLNLFNYKSPGCDDAIRAARQATDESERARLYEKVRSFVFDDVPVFYTHYDTPAYLANSDVLGVTARPTLELAWDEIGFAQDA